MLKQKAYAGAGDGQARGTVRERNLGGWKRNGTGQCVLSAGAGSGVASAGADYAPGGGVYGGWRPLGVSFAPPSRRGAMAAYIGAVVGYLLPGGRRADAYIAALVAVAGIKWSLSGIRSVSRHPVFAPALSFLSVAATGLALSAVGGLDASDVLLALAEGLLAGGSAYFFATTVNLLKARPCTG